MAAKAEQIITLPNDSGNTGKKLRVKESVVGTNTVEEYFFIQSTERSETGRYKFSVPAIAIPTAAHVGTTTGFVWIWNPLASTVKMAVDRISLSHGFSTTLAVDLIAPMLRISRFSATGTLSGATVTPIKRNSNDAAAQGLIATASTGLTVTLVGTLIEYLGQTMDIVTGGAGHWNAQKDEWMPNEEADELVLAPGEGAVIWSTFAVTTANRKLIANGSWKEFN